MFTAVLASAGGALAVLSGAPRLVVAQSPQILTESRGYAIDIVIVVALFGAALFVICRSSRRV